MTRFSHSYTFGIHSKNGNLCQNQSIFLINYVDDNYLIKGNRNKEVALQRLQVLVQKVEKWLTSSGMKVNIEKTEIAIFHKTDTATTSIKINNTHQESNVSTGRNIRPKT